MSDIYEPLEWHYGGGTKQARVLKGKTDGHQGECGVRWHGHRCPVAPVVEYDGVSMCAWHHWSLTGTRVDHLTGTD